MTLPRRGGPKISLSMYGWVKPSSTFVGLIHFAGNDLPRLSTFRGPYVDHLKMWRILIWSDCPYSLRHSSLCCVGSSFSCAGVRDCAGIAWMWGDWPQCLLFPNHHFDSALQTLLSGWGLWRNRQFGKATADACAKLPNLCLESLDR